MTGSGDSSTTPRLLAATSFSASPQPFLVRHPFLALLCALMVCLHLPVFFSTPAPYPHPVPRGAGHAVEEVRVCPSITWWGQADFAPRDLSSCRAGTLLETMRILTRSGPIPASEKVNRLLGRKTVWGGGETAVPVQAKASTFFFFA